MIENGGLVLLFAWSMFAVLLAVLGFIVLRGPIHPVDEAKKAPEDRPDVP